VPRSPQANAGIRRSAFAASGRSRCGAEQGGSTDHPKRRTRRPVRQRLGPAVWPSIRTRTREVATRLALSSDGSDRYGPGSALVRAFDRRMPLRSRSTDTIDCAGRQTAQDSSSGSVQLRLLVANHCSVTEQLAPIIRCRPWLRRSRSCTVFKTVAFVRSATLPECESSHLHAVFPRPRLRQFRRDPRSRESAGVSGIGGPNVRFALARYLPS
jgi:hypothetical protein